jgi:hypothetical protein
MVAKIVSIHASGLYAPYPFANAKVDDFVGGLDEFELGDTYCAVTATFAPASTRFAKIVVSDANGTPSVVVEFHGTNGKLEATPNLLL